MAITLRIMGRTPIFPVLSMLVILFFFRLSASLIAV